jgi:hypothetical protein
MGDATMDLAADSAVEAILRDELEREDRALGSVVPVLCHLLTSDGHSLISDAVLARVRGMLSDLARQFAAALAGHEPGVRMPGVPDESGFARLAADRELVGFAHMLATESLLAERFQHRHAIDPVLSPLLQELIAAIDPAIAELAMKLLAAQSRFIQSQRRMELPLTELPAELFHRVLTGSEAHSGGGIARLQQAYDEAATRLGLLTRLAAALHGAVVAALSLDHAGLALFASALARRSRQPRARALLSCHEGQGARLALALKAAQADLAVIERQFLLVEPAARLPRAVAMLSPERARLLLDAAG